MSKHIILLIVLMSPMSLLAQEKGERSGRFLADSVELARMQKGHFALGVSMGQLPLEFHRSEGYLSRWTSVSAEAFVANRLSMVMVWNMERFRYKKDEARTALSAPNDLHTFELAARYYLNHDFCGNVYIGGGFGSGEFQREVGGDKETLYRVTPLTAGISVPVLFPAARRMRFEGGLSVSYDNIYNCFYFPARFGVAYRM